MSTVLRYDPTHALVRQLQKESDQSMSLSDDGVLSFGHYEFKPLETSKGIFSLTLDKDLEVTDCIRPLYTYQIRALKLNTPVDDQVFDAKHSIKQVEEVFKTILS